MRLSVLIPTFLRRSYLERALRGLARQERAADQIVLGVREGDEETLQAVQDLPVTVAATTQPGVIASMTAALARTDGDVVCLLDDDAEPTPDWLARIARRFAENPRLGVLGGRDLLQDHPEMRATEPTTDTVGMFTWYGRILGNHHRGAGPFRPVDLVKGCNAAVRGPLLREMGFIQDLRGSGAQVHWELALCLDTARRGYSVAYDPEIRVIHHVAPRHDADQIHRGAFSSGPLYDMVWNEHHVVATRAGGWRKLSHLVWSIAAGSLTAPGCAQYVRLLARRDPDRTCKLITTLRAIRDGRTSCVLP